MPAKIISAFPACGKSTFYKKWSRYSEQNVWNDTNIGDRILDSDSSLFSWIYDENGNRTDQRNPDFPNNYIQHIKEHLYTEDIIFVSSHKVVRDALKNANIPYYLVYPQKDMKDEWLWRFKHRGNDESFIKFQEEHWDEFIDDMENETYPTKIKLKPWVNYNAITVTLMNDIIHPVEN